MSRSFSCLRRGLLSLVLAGSLGFGAAQAFASPGLLRADGSCEATGYKYIPNDCPECGGLFGYCDGVNEYCICDTGS